jgi:hypothetical protein
VKRTVAVAVLAIGALALAGCASAPAGASVGVWQLTEPESIDAATTILELEVTRLECAGGVTGEVLEPVVTFEPDRILIRTDVLPLPEGAYDCQSNDWVPVTVELSEAIGDRHLMDAACLDDEAASTVFCEDGGVRWSPPS